MGDPLYTKKQKQVNNQGDYNRMKFSDGDLPVLDCLRLIPSDVIAANDFKMNCRRWESITSE